MLWHFAYHKAPQCTTCAIKTNNAILTSDKSYMASNLDTEVFFEGLWWDRFHNLDSVHFKATLFLFGRVQVATMKRHYHALGKKNR